MIPHLLIIAALNVLPGEAFVDWVKKHPPPRLVWSMRVSGSSLVIEYEFFNDTNDTIYLGDELWVGKPPVRVADLIGASLYETEGRVTFSKATDRLDGLMNCTACVDAPFHVRVLPHHSHRGRAIAPLPLQDTLPCTDGVGRSAFAALPKSAVLELQYYPARERKDFSHRWDENLLTSDPLPFPPGTTFDLKPPSKK